MILDLFAGPGGWDLALRDLGHHDVVGLELDAMTCATRAAAGFRTVRCDISTYPPGPFVGKVDGLIASPPCQTFSAAGPQQGIDTVRGQLVWEPLRFVRALTPTWVAMEEVKEVEPVWRVYERELRALGYFTWSGLLNAADYGVPQSRLRAFFMAHRDFPVAPAAPSHAKSPGAELFGPQREAWVTMAEALGLTEPESPAHAWAWHRPATTVVRSFRPDVIAAPGYRLAGDGPRQTTPGSFTVTVEQMAVLQGTPPDFPFQGAKTKRQSLAGAILPPAMASAILRPLLQKEAVCLQTA